MIEIELKARLSPSERERVFAYFQERYKAQPVPKKDTYFLFPSNGNHGRPDTNTPRMIRVRVSGSEVICTVKQRSVERGVEKNREYEFKANDYQQVCAAFRLLGATVDIVKEKRGFAYLIDSLNVELVAVGRLGYFLEIEQIIPEKAYTTDRYRACVQQMHAFLRQLNISLTSIVADRYIDLLRDQSASPD